MIEMYGKEVKRNIKFDDRTNDLMMDIKLPQSSKWHNITIKQAIEARKIKEERDVLAIRAAGAERPLDKEKGKALMLTSSPGAISKAVMAGAITASNNCTPTGGKGTGFSMFSAGKKIPLVEVADDEQEEEASFLRADEESFKS